jgi:hypothetical protein
VVNAGDAPCAARILAPELGGRELRPERWAGAPRSAFAADLTVAADGWVTVELEPRDGVVLAAR